MDHNRIVKTFLALLISCLTLSAATTYPVLTDSTNRLFPGGVTNVFFLNSNVVTTGTMRATGALTLTNSGNVFAGDGSGLTGISGGGGTNSPTLNGTNVWTGTNTFTAANFFPANNIGLRLLWACPTNVYIENVISNSTLSYTNNGGFALISPVAVGTIPPLLGSNSSIHMVAYFARTNGNPSSANLVFYIGPNTNFISYDTPWSTSAGVLYRNLSQEWLRNFNSMTNQLQGATYQNPAIAQYSGTNFADTTVSNTVYFGAATSGTHTNAQIFGLRLYELYAP